MIRFAAVLHTWALTVTGRLDTLRSENERGSVSLEQVIITVALIAVALIAIGAITAAVNNRVGGIT